MPLTSALNVPQVHTTLRVVKESVRHAQAKHILVRSRPPASFAWKSKLIFFTMHVTHLPCYCTRVEKLLWSRDVLRLWHCFFNTLQLLLFWTWDVLGVPTWNDLWHWRWLNAREVDGGCGILAYSFHKYRDIPMSIAKSVHWGWKFYFKRRLLLQRIWVLQRRLLWTHVRSMRKRRYRAQWWLLFQPRYSNVWCLLRSGGSYSSPIEISDTDRFSLHHDCTSGSDIEVYILHWRCRVGLKGET